MTKNLRTVIPAGALGTFGIGVIGAVAVPTASAAVIISHTGGTSSGTVTTPTHTAPAPPTVTVTTVSTSSSSSSNSGFDADRPGDAAS